MELLVIAVEKANAVRVEAHSRFFKSSEKHLADTLPTAFAQQNALKTKYANFSTFSRSVTILKISKRKDSLCAVTEDCLMLHLALAKPLAVNCTDLSSLKEYLICDILLRPGFIIIGCTLP